MTAYSITHTFTRLSSEQKTPQKSSGEGGTVTWCYLASPTGRRGRLFNCPFSKNTNVHGGHGGGGGQDRPRQSGAESRMAPEPDQPEECDQQESVISRL